MEQPCHGVRSKSDDMVAQGQMHSRKLDISWFSVPKPYRSQRKGRRRQMEQPCHGVRSKSDDMVAQGQMHSRNLTSPGFSVPKPYQNAALTESASVFMLAVATRPTLRAWIVRAAQIVLQWILTDLVRHRRPTV